MSDIEELEERLDAVAQEAEDARKFAQRAIRERNELAEEVESLRSDVEYLRREQDRLRNRTDMLQQVRQASALKPDERAAVLIQTLYNDAHANQDDGLHPKAKQTTKQARSALGGGVQRSKAWQAQQRAVELVAEAAGQDDVPEDARLLQWVKRSRSHSEDSHLLLDLRNGEMPAAVSGFDIAGPGGVVADD